MLLQQRQVQETNQRSSILILLLFGDIKFNCFILYYDLWISFRITSQKYKNAAFDFWNEMNFLLINKNMN